MYNHKFKNIKFVCNKNNSLILRKYNNNTVLI